MKRLDHRFIIQKLGGRLVNREKIIVIDFGGQYNQLVARRVRECNVYCEIYSYRTDIEKIKEMNPKGCRSLSMPILTESGVCLARIAVPE